MDYFYSFCGLPSVWNVQKPPNIKSLGCESQIFCNYIFYLVVPGPVTGFQNSAKPTKPSVSAFSVPSALRHYDSCILFLIFYNFFLTELSDDVIVVFNEWP
jgi:hypothetical protein